MDDSTRLAWIDQLQEQFFAEGNGGLDYFWVLRRVEEYKRMNFPQLLFDATNGIGCTVGEGWWYWLDQNLDNPDNFGEVSFVCGFLDSSILSIPQYLMLTELAGRSYIEFFPEYEEAILRNLARLNKRYKDVVRPPGAVRETMANNPFFNLLNEIELRNRRNRDVLAVMDTPPSIKKPTVL